MYRLILVGALALQPMLVQYKPSIDSRTPEIGAVIEEKQFTQYEPATPVKRIGEPRSVPQTYSGSHADWMRAAGIAESDWAIVEKLIQKESSWNPNARNPSSGACGLPQALPCSKLGSEWNNPVHALRWADNYCKQRYGGWSGAWSFWTSHHWY